MHYTEDEIYELSLAREPRNSLSSVSWCHINAYSCMININAHSCMININAHSCMINISAHSCMIDALAKMGLIYLCSALYQINHRLFVDPLIFTRQQNFGLDQFVNICRRQIQCCLTHYHTMPHFDALKIYSCGKHYEKRRNCL